MQFRLTYEGPLHASQRDPPAGQVPKHRENRHNIRMTFHEQLKRLWEEYPSLRPATSIEEFGFMTYQRTGQQRASPPRMDAQRVADAHQLHGFRFVPLVTSELELLCDLEILLLRPDKPGGVVWAGDLDNRLKNLLDALKIPESGEKYQERKGQIPECIYCLLEDDKLITRVSVDSDTMLMPVNSNLNDHDVRLVITARLKPYRLLPINIGFG